MFFVAPAPPLDVDKTLMLSNLSFILVVMLLFTIMTAQKDEAAIAPIASVVIALQGTLGKALWFLRYPVVGWGACLYVTVASYLRSQNQYRLGGEEWGSVLASFWRALSISAALICGLELLWSLKTRILAPKAGGEAQAKKKE
mmetsp:Transcript_70653/g.213861  ORF Transcript_70653/g.213861 Transcript_70653/m.213861 type:complete len:143 (-) Transcript_70653:89-517(-)